jgi:pimeloyl-ACP methyl ester carboxylesterase
VADYVEDVASVCATLAKPPVLIGHSLGGLVVQKYLEQHSAPAAVLLCPVPAGGMLLPGFRLLLRQPGPMLEMMVTLHAQPLYNTAERARTFLFSDSLPDAEVERYASLMGRESSRALLDMIFLPLRPGRVRTPLLIVGAEGDAIVPARWIERTARAYGADARVFLGMAHDLMLEPDWKLVAQHTLSWLQALRQL